MFPDSFFNSAQGTREHLAEQLQELFFKIDNDNKSRAVDIQLGEEYLQAVHQFRAFCDPYGVIYKYPSTGRNPDEAIQLIREFFTNLETF